MHEKLNKFSKTSKYIFEVFCFVRFYLISVSIFEQGANFFSFIINIIMKVNIFDNFKFYTNRNSFGTSRKEREIVAKKQRNEDVFVKREINMRAKNSAEDISIAF